MGRGGRQEIEGEGGRRTWWGGDRLWFYPELKALGAEGGGSQGQGAAWPVTLKAREGKAAHACPSHGLHHAQGGEGQREGAGSGNEDESGRRVWRAALTLFLYASCMLHAHQAQPLRLLAQLILTINCHVHVCLQLCGVSSDVIARARAVLEAQQAHLPLPCWPPLAQLGRRALFSKWTQQLAALQLDGSRAGMGAEVRGGGIAKEGDAGGEAVHATLQLLREVADSAAELDGLHDKEEP